MAVAGLQGLAYESEVDMLSDKPQGMILRNVIFYPEVVGQRLLRCVLTHHDEQRASANSE